MKIWTERSIPAAPILMGSAALFALLLALPGQTVATKYLNDLFVILDSTYRTASGQAPNLDSHTPLGPLSYYLPALGYKLSGTLGGAMPVAMAIGTIMLALPMAHVLSSRLHPLIAIPFGVFLLLIVAVPINLGESITALSFAKYYNRIGWAALGVLLVMYLSPERRHRHQDFLDAACAAALTLVMLYTKLTYGVAALVFLLFMLTDPRQRRWSGMAIGAAAVTGLMVEAFWQSSLAHIADLRMASEVGGLLRGTWGQIADHVLGNLTDYVLLGLFAVLALRSSRNLRDFLFYGFCAVAGFLIINQNFQAWGIITLHAAAAVAAETLIRAYQRRAVDPDEHRWSTTTGAKLLFLAMVLPAIVHCTAALSLHTVAALAKAGEPVGLPRLEQVRLANLWTWNDYDAAIPYLAALRDGAEALSQSDRRPERIFVLDLANPFSMALQAPPPKGDTPWLQWDRTLNATAHVPPERLLGDVQIVMQPKPASNDAIAQTNAQVLQELYGPYLAANFDVARETEHWKLHRRRQTPPQAVLHEAGRT